MSYRTKTQRKIEKSAVNFVQVRSHCALHTVNMSIRCQK